MIYLVQYIFFNKFYKNLLDLLSSLNGLNVIFKSYFKHNINDQNILKL